ncbi:MAG: choice-of-anchor Q domain-containing protein [Luteolibacter sp.]
MIKFVITCLITATTLAHAADTYVAKPGDFSPPNPNVNDTVTWKSGTPDAVNNLIFGTDAFTSIIDASSAAGSGDTVYIASGTYTEGSPILLSDDRNFVGDGPGITILDGASSHILFQLVSSVTIEGLTIQNGFSGSGDACIVSNGPQITLRNIHFVDNTTGGVDIFNPGGFEGIFPPHVVRIEDCLFSNTAGFSSLYYEGAENSIATVTNTTFSSNPTLAVYAYEGTLILSHCTFYDNQVAFDTTEFEDIPTSVSLNNSIVLDPYSALGIISNGTNFLATDTIGAGDFSYSNTTATVPEDVIDIALSDNGGSTATHKLAVNSVAIDAGTNSDAVDADNNPIEFDQRGKPFMRISNGIVDIGAFELPAPTMTLSIADSSISENGGTTTVTVLRNSDTEAALTVNLFSDDVTEATVPASLEIPIGQASATFTLTAVDDAILDGTQIVNITASSSGFINGTDTLNVLDDEASTLTLAFADPSISENGGSTSVTVTRSTNPTSELTVNLLSDDATEATVPSTVSILAGQASATFTLTAVDDAILDGTQSVNITASASGFIDGSGTLNVLDDEASTLTLSILATSISENGGNTSVTVTRSTNPTSELTVNLFSDDVTEATVPATVSILAGQASATFTLTAVDDAILDGTQSVNITATSTGFTDGTGLLDVTDDDVATLTLAIADPSISENGGSSTVTVSRNTDTTSALTVNLSSDDETEATVPPTLTIPAGNASATVTLTAVDDAIIDGTQIVTISASASGFTDGSDQLEITNDDLHAQTYVAKHADFSPPNPNVNDTVTWKPNNPDAVSGLIFGVNAFTGIINASLETEAGGTVYIAGGTYTEGDVIVVDKDLNFEGAGPGLTILDGGSTHSLFALNQSATIKNLTIQNGSTSDPNAGGISSLGSELTLSNIHFVGNSSSSGVGALLILSPEGQVVSPHVVSIEGCLFNNNSGPFSGIYYEGPAAAPRSSRLTITNTTFSSHQNSAIDAYTGTLTLTHCTFYDNQVAFDASGNEFATGASVSLNNSLVFDNYFESGITSNGTNFLATDTISAGDLSYANTSATVPADVIDIVLADNGGATATHKLAVNSVAIDAGTNANAVDADNNPLLYDQRGFGFLRISQGTVDIGAFEEPSPTLTVSITDASIPENGGSSTVTVSRNTDTTSALTVNLSSDDESEATVPPTLTIPAGDVFATATLTAVDDAIVDGTQTVTISATATGFIDGSDQLDITDDDITPPALTLSITDPSISENGGNTTITVSRNTDTTNELTVDLSSDDESEATLPTTLTIPAGDISATATLTSVDDAIVDGTQTVNISVSSSGFIGDSGTLDVTDDDIATLTLSIADASISENGGSSTITVSRNTDVEVELTVDLSSNDETEATVPATLTIPAGDVSATATLTAVDDAIVDGTQTVTISATSSGFIDGSDQLDITDDDVATLTLSIADASISENGGTTTVTVSLNTEEELARTVDLFSDDEFAATVPAIIDIPAGQTSATFTLTAVDDSKVDGSQTVTITASATGFIDGTDTLDVTDDDVPTLTLSIADPSISENGGTTTVTVSRNTDVEVELTVDLLSDNVSESTVPTTLTIPAGDVSATATLTAVDDAIVDGTQTVTITASATGFIDGTDTLDVTDDDVPTLTLSIADPSISENGGTTTVTVSRNTDVEVELTVDLLSDNVSEATVPTTLTIPAGDISATATLSAVDDAIVDGTQTVTITASATGFIDGSDQLDITDDDFPTLTLSIADPSISENGGTTTVTVSRNTDIEVELTVDLLSDDESEATLPTTLTIPAGDVSATATLTAVDDTIVDGTQTVTITASATGFIDGSDQLDITDDDVATLTLSIADPSISENGGTSTVTVSRNTDVEVELTVTLSSDDLTEATVPATLTIPAGDISATATLTAVDDSIVDGTQTVTISASTSGFIDGSDQLDITDDDVATLTLSIADPSISENGGTTTVTVTRNTTTEIGLTVSLLSDDETEAIVPATLDIPAGQASTTFTLTAVDDAILDGTQMVNISASASGFADSNSQLDITDDELPALALVFADPSISENGGSTSVTVTRSTNPTNELTVNLLSDDLSEATVPATVSIPAGQASTTFTLTAVDDAIVDGTQTVNITASASGFIDGTQTLNVLDDEVPTLTLAIADPSISENGGSTSVTVTRSTSPASQLTVNLLSDDLSEATVPATVDIPAGQISATFTLTAVDDAILDGTQIVNITASASGFTDGTDTLNVLDDELPTLTLAFAEPSISENGGSTSVTVTRSTSPASQLTVNLLSDDLTEATVPATVSILAGQASATFTLTAVDDAILDGTQIVNISATATGFADGNGSLDITDDEVPTLTLAIANPVITENGGSTSVTVSRNSDPGSELTVNLSSDDETEATVPATVTILTGQTSATFTLTAVDDAIFDDTQTVTIIATTTGFIEGSDQVDVTDDDPLLITLEGGATLSEPDSFSSSPLSPSETDLTLIRNGTLGDVIVNIEIAPGFQADIGNDFTINGAALSTFGVTIPDGQSEVAIPVQAIDDIAAEDDETFVVLLTPGSFVSGNTSVVFSIAQNDYGVTSLEDFNSIIDPNGGEGTLRQAIANAKADLTIANVPPSDPVIIFRPDLAGEIKLTAGAFQLDQSSFSIIGSGSQQVSINGQGASRVFFVSDPEQDLTYSISGLSMIGGYSAANGGAIFSNESLLLSDCVLSGCAANIGGAIANEGILQLENCTLSNNTATVYGGAIDNFFSTLSLRGCTLTENQAEFGGGIENSTGSQLWVDSSTFFLNSANSSGGAIDSFRSITNISNTTISGNQAGFGAGILNEQSTLSIWQSTIVENSALNSVGGILTSATLPVSTIIHNTIVAGNTESGSPSDLSTNNLSFLSINQFSSNNLIGDGNSAGGLINGINGNIVGTGATSIFRPLADNGGPTTTHALLPNSLAIDAGSPIFAIDSEALTLTTDQRGLPRFAFGTNDIGAFEVSENPISIVSLDVNPGVSVDINWTSEAGVSYDVLRSTDLNIWQKIASRITAEGGLTSWTDKEPPLDRAFYIIRISTAE